VNIYKLMLLTLITLGLNYCSEDSDFRGKSDLNRTAASDATNSNPETDTQTFGTGSEDQTSNENNPNEETAGDDDLSGAVTITQQAVSTEEGEAAAEEGSVNTSTGETDPMADGKMTCTEAAYLNGATSAAHYCIFASRYGYTGNLGGLVGADSKCAELATSSGLAHNGVTWKAVLSDNTQNAKDRIVLDKKIYSTKINNGATFAYYLIAEANQLWTNPQGPLVYNEIGTYDQYKEPETYHGNHTWTSTRSSGTNSGGNCSGWTSNSGAGHVGDASGGAGDTDQWLDGSKATQPCGNRHQIYCISQP